MCIRDSRIFVVATFGLFTNGLDRFDKAVEDGTIYKVVTTNLTYQTPELLSRPYYINCEMCIRDRSMQLLNGKSIIRYLTPNATAGFATFDVRTPKRLP